MKTVFFTASSVNHLRFIGPMQSEFARRGIHCELIYTDLSNSPDGGGVEEALGAKASANPGLKLLPRTEFDACLRNVKLPTRGFRSLPLLKRIFLLLKAKFPRVKFDSQSLLILFNDTGAFEKRLLWEARQAGARVAYIQDGLTNLRAQNFFTRRYYRLVSPSFLFLYLPMPQSCGPWDKGFFLGDFWKEYSQSWRTKRKLADTQFRTLGQFQFWISSPPKLDTLVPPPPRSKKLGILCAVYELARDATPEAEDEFLKSFSTRLLELSKRLQILVRPHPRSPGEPTLVKYLKEKKVPYEISPETESLFEFAESADVFFSLGSYAAFEILRMGKPCFLIMRPFSKMIGKIADRWNELDPETLLDQFYRSVNEALTEKTLAELHLHLSERYEYYISQKLTTAASLTDELMKLDSWPPEGLRSAEAGKI